ncbi:MAG: tetratricopeptide repeat protein [Kofleriaceae bacterium]
MPCPPEALICDFAARALPPRTAAEVEAHIAECEDCRNLVFALASGGGQPGEAPAPSAHTRVGRFELIDVLGQGSMGIVYRARDPELDRQVAIKIRRNRARLSADGDDRLRREAQALARLTHPNVVTVFETGTHDGMPYVAMEYIDGVTLDVWLRTPRGTPVVLGLMLDAGRGLAAAHAVGLIHRDFKPRNVFVSRSAAAKVGDFGLARLDTSVVPEASSGDSEIAMTLSVAGSVIGTPAYMAPEQLRGAPATEASDQFSYCVTLFEVLFGQRPFTASTIPELLAAMTAPLRMPAAPRIPARVRRALERGLASEPAQRFGSMTALLDAMTPRSAVARWVAAGAAVGAVAAVLVAGWVRSPSLGERCLELDPQAAQVFGPGRQREIEAAFLETRSPSAAAAANAVGRWVASYGQRWRAASTAVCRDAVDQRVSPQIADRQRACLERRLQELDALTAVLSSTNDPTSVTRAVSALESLPEVESCTHIASVLDEGEPPPSEKIAAVRALETRVNRVASLREIGQWTQANAEIDQLVRDVRAVGYSPLTARALLVQADVLESNDTYEPLDAILDEAVREAAKARDNRMEAAAWTKRVYAVGIHFARYGDAHKWASAADAAVLRSGNPPGPRAVLDLYLGSLWLEQGELAKARDAIEAGLALRQKFFAGYPLAIADARNMLAMVLQREGKLRDAGAQLQQALALYRGVYGDDHPRVADFESNLGFLLSEAGRPREALIELEKAVAIGERLLGPTHFVVGHALSTMGSIYMTLGDYDKAMQLHRRSYEIMRAKFSDRHPRVGYALGNMALVAQRTGDYAAARGFLDQAQAIFTNTWGASHDMVARVHSGIAATLEATGDHAGALAALGSAMAIFERNHGNDSAELNEVRLQLGELHALHGDVTKARGVFEQAAAGLGEAPVTNLSALRARAGIVYCDAVQHRVERTRLDELETALAAVKLDALERHERAFLLLARARAHGQLGDRDQARELATASRDDYAAEKLEPARRTVEQLLKELR